MRVKTAGSLILILLFCSLTTAALAIDQAGRSGSSPETVTGVSATVQLFAQNEDPLADNEDPLAEDEDPLAEDEDPLAEDEDPLADDEATEPEMESESDDEQIPEEEDDDYPIRTTIKNRYSLFSGYSEIDRGGIGRENEADLDRKSHLSNSYQFAARIQTSPYHFYQLRILNRFSQGYNHENNQYTDDFDFQIREAYYRGISGSHRYTIGAQLLKLGKIDYDSPLDILNPKDAIAFEYLDLEELKLPVAGIKYDLIGETHSFSAYFMPFKQRTAGTEYTIFQKEEEEKQTGKLPPDRSVTRPHFGVQYQGTFDLVDIRLSLFHWADPDNDISWQGVAEGDETDDNTETTTETDEETEDEESADSGATQSVAALEQGYTEEDTTTTFGAVEIDMTLGGFVLKSDIALFAEKNIYSFFEKADSTLEFRTVRVPHAAIAVSLEKKLETMFIMPVYSYRLLKDVPGDTHILTYENRATPLSETRDLYRHQLSIVFATEFSEQLNTVLTISQTTPFRQQTIVNLWNWSPGGGDHGVLLKLFHSSTEKLKQTGKQIGVTKGFVGYTYQF